MLHLDKSKKGGLFDDNDARVEGLIAYNQPLEPKTFEIAIVKHFTAAETIAAKQGVVCAKMKVFLLGG